MNEIKFEPGKHGLRATIVASWREEMAQALVDANIAELELNHAKGWAGNNLLFLRLLPGLKVLDLLDPNLPSIEGIHSAKSLIELSLISYNAEEVSFEEFPLLERCSLQWHVGKRSVFTSATLKEFFVDGYRGCDLSEFRALTNLESLTILNSNVESLEGIQGLFKLRKLQLGRLPKLSALEGLEALNNLEELEVQRCKRLTSIDPIEGLTRLRKLWLLDDGEIRSLKPISNSPQLRSVLFYGSTTIADGDLTPLLSLPDLEAVSFMNRKHYSHRREDFRQYGSG